MMQREIGSFKNNSIAFNIIEDDPAMKSYLALAYCIAGIKVGPKIKHPSIDQAVRALGLKGNLSKNKINVDKRIEIPKCITKKGTKKVKRVGRKVIATNVKTNEIITYNNTGEAYKALGMEKNNLATYMKNGTAVNGTWLVRFEGEEQKIKPRQNKRCLVTNINTGEEKEFKTIKDAAKFLGKKSDTISKLAKACKITREGWEIKLL